LTDSKTMLSITILNAFELNSGPIVALVLKGEEVVRGWQEMIGPMDPEEAKVKAPSSIIALYGTDKLHNAVHCSHSVDDATREIHLLFPRVLKSRASSARPSSAGRNPADTITAAAIAAGADPSEVAGLLEKLGTRTLALIKPDAYGADKKYDIIARIKEAGFTISFEKELQMTLDQAKEFYKEHLEKPFYNDLTEWMSSAPIYALVLEKKDAVSQWRELAGPTNSEKAREVAPHRYGFDSL
jgi:nucleoside diphosphate kinase